jgi:hypothetical protein
MANGRKVGQGHRAATHQLDPADGPLPSQPQENIMKKLLVTAGVAGLLFAGAGSALAASENASPKACFGQARAEYSSANGGTDASTGKIISGRAQDGTNAEQNRAFKEACQP